MSLLESVVAFFCTTKGEIESPCSEVYSHPARVRALVHRFGLRVVCKLLRKTPHCRMFQSGALLRLCKPLRLSKRSMDHGFGSSTQAVVAIARYCNIQSYFIFYIHRCLAVLVKIERQERDEIGDMK